MKIRNLKGFFPVLGMSFLLVVISCDKDNEGNTSSQIEGNKLTGVITRNLVLTKNTSYKLSGEFRVKKGAMLTIPSGVTITAQTGGDVDYILIERGAKINAQGTSAHPIVMTSVSKQPGAWAGLHICGAATINLSSGDARSEIGNSPYGGTNDADNSGVLKYVRVEYAGGTLNGKNGNGIAFYGVGTGTTVDYVQAYKGADDGFEFYGGTVNVKHLVSTSNKDDAFDWSEGWRGKAQFLVAYQEAKSTLNYECDALMECENKEGNESAAPISHPVIANVTLVGNNSTVKTFGLSLDSGAKISLYNALITNKAKCLVTKTVETENALKDASSILQYVYLQNTITSLTGGYLVSEFTSSEGNGINQSIALSNSFVGTVSGGKNMPEVNSFFVAANYKGAVLSSNNWTSGWTR